VGNAREGRMGWEQGTAEKNKGYSETANAICHCLACDED